MKIRAAILIIFAFMALYLTAPALAQNVDSPEAQKRDRLLEKEKKREDRKRMKAADDLKKETRSEARKAKENAREANRINQEAEDAAKQAKKSARLEAKAQKNRQKADKQARKAAKANR